MTDDPKARAVDNGQDWLEFPVTGIRGLYVPFVGGFMRLIPNTPEALASAQNSLHWSRAAWQN